MNDPEFIRQGLYWMLGVLVLGLLVCRLDLWGRPPDPAGKTVRWREPLPHTPTREDSHTEDSSVN